MRSRPPWRLPLGVLLSAALLSGCGVPATSTAERIPTVPYGLTSPSESEPPTHSSTAPGDPLVWLVHEDRLVPVAAPPPGPDPRATAVSALTRLAAGPTDQERADGLSSALGPDVQLALTDLSDGRAVVDVRAGDQAPSPGRLPRAVGQVVLTLVSIDGIDEVVLTVDGQNIEAPLPGGELTSEALQADDYATLATPAPEASS